MTRWVPMLGVAWLMSLLVGCAHRTRIESNPSGAHVFIGGEHACLTPCLYSTPATKLRRGVPLRIERTGYAPVESTLKTHIATSRLVGGVFTIGLVPLFKWPHTYEGLHMFYLHPLSQAERLELLDRRRASGEITDHDYKELRLRVLEGDTPK